jgi:hypothetical protein
VWAEEVKTTLHMSIFSLICHSEIYAFDIVLKSEVGTANVFLFYGMSRKVGLAVEYGNLGNHCFIKSRSRQIKMTDDILVVHFL